MKIYVKIGTWPGLEVTALSWRRRRLPGIGDRLSVRLLDGQVVRIYIDGVKDVGRPLLAAHYRCTKPGRATDGRSYHLGSLYAERQAAWIEIQPSPPKALQQPRPDVT